MRHLMTTASLAVLCLCASTPALAHDPDPGDPGDPVRLEEVIVTATRLPQPEGETPGARVFTEAESELLQAQPVITGAAYERGERPPIRGHLVTDNSPGTCPAPPR